MKSTKIEVSEKTHQDLKVYCAQRGLRMGNFVDSLIRERIDNELDGRDIAGNSIKSQDGGDLQDHKH